MASGGRFEFVEVGDLFSINPTKNYGLTDKYLFKEKGDIPVIVNSSFNNGVGGYVSLEPTEDAGAITFSDTTTSDSIFYQPRAFIGYSHVQGMRAKIGGWTDNSLKYFVSIFRKATKGLFDYGNKFNRENARKITVCLPKFGNLPAFSYMENFITELQAERLQELQGYLQATGLSNYTLTDEEQRAIDSLERVKWETFNIIDIFNVKNTHSILSSWITPNSGIYPYVTAGEGNNSISTYIDYDLSQSEKGNSIMIGGKTLVITYQENDYFSNDSHNLALYVKNEQGTEKSNQLFMISSLYKSLKPRYSWGDSISKKKIKSDVFDLPVKDGQIDYEFMSILIRAIQKLVIADVVKYADKELVAYKQVIS